ncbi:MAG: hypothetical protein II849_09325 [Bacteroidales bacterium]|nr:hypothetical protein [Bacteroidales bacterium]
MNNKITVEITLSRMVWKALRHKYADDGRAVEVGGWELTLIASMLERKKRFFPRLEGTAIANAETYSVYIPLYLFYRHGGYVNLNNAVKINSIVRGRETDFVCEAAALLRAATRMSRETCLASILDKNGYTEADIHLETIKKKYYRRYIPKERGYASEIELIKAANRRTPEKKSF